MPKENPITVLHLLAEVVILYLLIASFFSFHLVLQLCEHFLLTHNLLVDNRHATEVGGAMNDITLLFQF